MVKRPLPVQWERRYATLSPCPWRTSALRHIATAALTPVRAHAEPLEKRSQSFLATGAQDFRVRYRNMSLGMFWSLLNPLVMMALLTFVFSASIAQPRSRTFRILLRHRPFNFFTLSG